MKRALRIGLGLLALALAAFVWPTMYRYEHGAIGNGTGDWLIRINRITGEAQVFTGAQWGL